ncbi:XRE family transcriptional regulator [Flavobacterium sp. SOK18b]|uniref:helix-turn-helix domain-containing protein n=1 Tax=Flavobacterium sp. SOK18b TaxID=797900 RepID=UPI0015FA96E3|nr:helix-turn-helix transcriptional regulator [Flavobacterium sp. SOK18b]MBB1194828.1 XRE family transcriptional regulator [Flavobacterium sp. SOK18b]
MVNIEDFIKRLEIILDYYGLNASSFADKIGVQRSSLSHLLSGRNKPSLDFILKILDVFPEVDLYWILNGKGSFPKLQEFNVNNLNIKENRNSSNFDTEVKSNSSTADLFTDFIPPIPNIISEIPFPTKNTTHSDQEEIETIMIFYKNGTFKQYTPK